MRSAAGKGGIGEGANDRAHIAGGNIARRAKWSDLDVMTTGLDGGDRVGHVRAQATLDERLDGELDVDHRRSVRPPATWLAGAHHAAQFVGSGDAVSPGQVGRLDQAG
ncbi:MAG: hypothetical protein AAFY28_20830, partial [Actinomycetota bacterium]